MPFGQNKFISALHLRVLWVDVHLLEIQRGHNVCGRKRPTRVSGPCLMYCFYNVRTDPRSNLLVVFEIHVFPP